MVLILSIPLSLNVTGDGIIATVTGADSDGTCAGASNTAGGDNDDVDGGGDNTNAGGVTGGDS